ncbi:GNAT superfamily N-acetyltransferase [Friedmanniella endophytica]|uniref:GNAT superfamily N-acetyltransferase n=1 Tax=Microlunatus kandeliicorticis TaxID=1759536 RepID=A0A7W3P7S1_9ACTN|nr:GNAT family N-acetyltransferase [Microlunatus kandeliicorticis]MBA8796290.1 GNAT superfamily N-acetyltransferase [Microlunatus kandeliicorticis]
MTEPAQTADSARLAMVGEAPVLAEIQRRAWPDRLPADAVARLSDELGLEAMAQAWERAIARPPEARCRVLVAVSGTGRLAGFAVTSPSDDPDADPARTGTVEEFVIDPAARGRGHGSRLLNACADTLRADGFTRATWWLPAGDDATRAFLAGAGWEPDGAHREIGTEDGTVRIKQVRLHTDLG